MGNDPDDYYPDDEEDYYDGEDDGIAGKEHACLKKQGDDQIGKM